MKDEIRNYLKPYDELTYSDDFMFGKTMEDRALCRDVLQCLLQSPVGELDELTTQKQYRHTKDGKFIRLDVCTRDNTSIYDAEMQNLGRKSVEYLELPKRSRFYQSAIDMDVLDGGDSYGSLPSVRIMFICTFDPFGLGLPMYTFRERCDEDMSLVLESQALKHFFNCTYMGDDVPEEIQKLYEYIRSGKAGDPLTQRIDDAVSKVRLNVEWRSAYMKERVILMDARRDGREEGMKEGIKEGIKEGRYRLIISMLKNGVDADNISRMCDIPLEEVKTVEADETLVKPALH